MKKSIVALAAAVVMMAAAFSVAAAGSEVSVTFDKTRGSFTVCGTTTSDSSMVLLVKGPSFRAGELDGIVYADAKNLTPKGEYRFEVPIAAGTGAGEYTFEITTNGQTVSKGVYGCQIGALTTGDISIAGDVQTGVSASVVVTNAYGAETVVSPVLLLAIYDSVSDCLIKADVASSVSIAAGQTATLSAGVSGMKDDGRYYAKAFLWDSIETLSPVAECRLDTLGV